MLQLALTAGSGAVSSTSWKQLCFCAFAFIWKSLHGDGVCVEADRCNSIGCGKFLGWQLPAGPLQVLCAVQSVSRCSGSAVACCTEPDRLFPAGLHYSFAKLRHSMPDIVHCSSLLLFLRCSAVSIDSGRKAR